MDIFEGFRCHRSRRTFDRCIAEPTENVNIEGYNEGLASIIADFRRGRRQVKPLTSSLITKLSQSAERLTPGTDVVYFESCDSFIKIGHTREHLWRRMSNIQVNCPFEIVLLGFIPGIGQTEKIVRDAFRAFRHRGEWINPDEGARRAVTGLIREFQPMVPDTEFRAGRLVPFASTYMPRMENAS